VQTFAAENDIERFSLHQLADDEVLIIGGDELIKARQIRLNDGGHGGYSFLNLAAAFRIGRQPWSQLADGNETGCFQVPGLIDRARGGLTDSGQNLVVR